MGSFQNALREREQEKADLVKDSESVRLFSNMSCDLSHDITIWKFHIKSGAMATG